MIKIKFLYLAIILLLEAPHAFSQSAKEMEAIVKFELAEEAYVDKEYIKALNYLEELKQVMGSIPKILHLQIMIELERSGDQLNSASINKLLGLIETFEKANGIEYFQEEKRWFVSRNKVLLNEKLSEIITKSEKNRKLEFERDKNAKIGKENFENFLIDDLPFGLSFEEFQVKYPNILPDKYKSSKYVEGIIAYYPRRIAFEDKENFLFPFNSSTGSPIYDTNIHVVFVKNNKVIGFQKNICYYNSKGQGNLNYTDASAEVKMHYQNFSESFVSIPFNTSSHSSNWVHENKGVHLHQDAYYESIDRWKISLSIRAIKLN